MHVPYRRAVAAIHPQDASFLEREVWDLDATPQEDFPLLLHYHPLVIYRHQVIKQADVVLAMFLLGDEFDADAQAPRTSPTTTASRRGDSSLSAVRPEHRRGRDRRRATPRSTYFRYALLMDLADAAGNVSDGVHIAAAGGRLAGARVRLRRRARRTTGELSIDPAAARGRGARSPSRCASATAQLRITPDPRGRALRARVGVAAVRHRPRPAGHARSRPAVRPATRARHGPGRGQLRSAFRSRGG